MNSPSQSTHTRVLPVLLLLVASVFSQFPTLKAQEKLQDKFGVQLFLQVEADPTQRGKDIEKSISLIQDRCVQLKVNCKLERQDRDHIILRFSSSKDPARVKSLLLSNGLELCVVISEPSPAEARTYASIEEAMKNAGTDEIVLPYDAREADAVSNEVYVIVKREPLVSGKDISDASAVLSGSDSMDYHIHFSIRPDGAQRFGEWTIENINKYLAVVFSKKVLSIAYIKSQILGSGEISGRFTKEQAVDLARVIRSGNLPAPIKVVSEDAFRP